MGCNGAENYLASYAFESRVEFVEIIGIYDSKIGSCEICKQLY
jgi:hypothetical protein